MKCGNCKIEMEKRHATLDHPYVYKQSGLDNLLLTGIDFYVCPECKAEAPVIPHAEHLYACLTKSVAMVPRSLLGDEVRFLRKHAGLPAHEFAALIGLTPEHLSRIENGRLKVGKNTDRLIRAMALTALKDIDPRKILVDLAHDLKAAGSRHRRSKVSHISYALKRPRNEWQPNRRTA